MGKLAYPPHGVDRVFVGGEDLQRLDVLKTQHPRQIFIDPYRRNIQIGVGADDGKPLADGLINQAIGSHLLHRIPDERMVGDDQLGAQLLRFRQHRWGTVQSQQGVSHLLLGVAYQKAGVVKIHLGGKGGDLINQVVNLLYVHSCSSNKASISCARAFSWESR